MNRVILDSTNDVVFWIDFLSIPFNINLCAVYIWTYYQECEILCSSNVFRSSIYTSIFLAMIISN